MLKSIVILLTILVVLVLTLRLFVLFLEARLTFSPSREFHANSSNPAIKFQEILIQTRDQENVCAWLLDSSIADTEVVFFHGNAGNLSIWQDFFTTIYNQQLTVLALDYRGYGKSSGSPTEKGVYLDAEALIQHFWKKIHRRDRKVVYWGRSLGGPIAAFASTIKQPHGLILESSFPSLRSLLTHYPILKFLNFFSSYRFPTTKWLNSVNSPVLVLHGDQDQIVPLVQGQLLFQQISGEDKYIHLIRGADHNNTHKVNPQLYWGQINQFITSLKNGKNSP